MVTESGMRLSLGIDLSTQGLKACAVQLHADDPQYRTGSGVGAVIYTAAVNFGRDFPQYNAPNGFHDHGGGEVTAPVLMFVEALDLLLQRMASEGFSFSQVVCVSGSAQQHGSVYWRKGSERQLQRLRELSTDREEAESTAASLSSLLDGAFSLPDSPLWLDSSTTAFCKRREEAVGGPERLAAISGSRAHERFTGNQIAKIAAQRPQIYEDTARISLISSFFASLFVGHFAPIDLSDGSGMNLLDIWAGEWGEQLLGMTADRLRDKLGPLVPSWHALGPIARYYQERFGFSPDCQVITFSGDNNNTAAGLGLAEGQLAISLGTSDTVMGITRQPHPGVEGHIFVSPTLEGEFLTLLCYKNGSMVREHLRDRVAGGSWDTFEELLRESAPGNEGILGLLLELPEIVPPIKVTGSFIRGPQDQPLVEDELSPEVLVRLAVEGRFLSMVTHSRRMGVEKVTKIFVAGGGSRNKEIVQVIADVFQAPVVQANNADTAALGAAYRAYHGWQLACKGEGELPFNELVRVMRGEVGAEVMPRTEYAPLYERLRERLERLEDQLSNLQSD